ncbi:long-chain fatty acid--CoA ligase, partial [Xenorhabdus sp. PR6a]|nr:long-chain fatty acid--CoA ligase [Xenorhabdus sp. PR6a]
SHLAGFSYLMTAVLLGIPTMVLTQISGQSVIDNVRNFRPTIIATFSETWAELKEFSLLHNELNFLLRCYNTGDMVHESHMKYLIQAAPKLRFYNVEAYEF